MYDVMDPSMPGFVFSAGYYLVAALSLGVLSRGSTGGDGGVGDGEMDNDDENENDVVRRGGWELGSYLFLGNGLQVVGLQTVPADRAGETPIALILSLLRAIGCFVSSLFFESPSDTFRSFRFVGGFIIYGE